MTLFIYCTGRTYTEDLRDVQEAGDRGGESPTLLRFVHNRRGATEHPSCHAGAACAQFD